MKFQDNSISLTCSLNFSLGFHVPSEVCYSPPYMWLEEENEICLWAFPVQVCFLKISMWKYNWLHFHDHNKVLRGRKREFNIYPFLRIVTPKGGAKYFLEGSLYMCCSPYLIISSLTFRSKIIMLVCMCMYEKQALWEKKEASIFWERMTLPH